MDGWVGLFLQLAELLLSAPREVRDQYFGEVVHVLLEGIKRPESPADQGGDGTSPLLRPSTGQSPEDHESLSCNVRYISLRWLHALLKHRPQQTAQWLDVIVGRVFECATDCFEVYHFAETKVLEGMIDKVNPDKYFQVGRRCRSSNSNSRDVVGVESSETPKCCPPPLPQVICSFLCVKRLLFPRMLMALRVLPKLVPKVSSPLLLASLPALTPLLVQEMNSPEIFMRMAVVCTLAEVRS